MRRAFTLQTTLALLNLSLAKCWFCKWEEAKAGSRVSSPDWNVPAAHSLELEWHLICRTASDWTVTDYYITMLVAGVGEMKKGERRQSESCLASCCIPSHDCIHTPISPLDPWLGPPKALLSFSLSFDSKSSSSRRRDRDTASVWLKVRFTRHETVNLKHADEQVHVVESLFSPSRRSA